MEFHAPEDSSPGTTTDSLPGHAAAQNRKTSLWERRKVTSSDLLAITHQMASALSSGLSFGATMEILLLPGVHRPTTREMLEEVAAKVNDGESLSSALSSRPDVFDELYISLVEAGELSAQLPETLRRLAEFQETRNRLRQNIIGSLVYPLFVMLFGVAMGTGMLAYGAPLVEEMYRSAGAELPWLSAVFIATGRWLGKGAVVFFLLAVCAVPLLRLLWKKRSVRRWVHWLALEWSITSALVQETVTARACRTLSVLYKNGVPILKALKLTGRSAGNILYEELFEQTAQDVKDGSPVALPLMCSPYFPPMAAGMLAAGEESGNLPDMLDHVADYYESRVEFTIQTLVKFLEPMLIIVVGAFIGLIVVALGIPFMNLMSVLA